MTAFLSRWMSKRSGNTRGRVRAGRRWLVATAVVCFTCPAIGQTLWFEGAESGLGGIVDGTDGSYPLIQSSVIGQGSYAFHLANPNASTNFFIVDPDVAPLADSRLYFLSRLGYATSDQVAQVEVSTNSGASWSGPLFSQPGDGGAGEGSFSQQSVDLAPYAGQDVSFRFALDFNSGSYYPQNSTNVGWLIDSIQMGGPPEKLMYSIGQPSDQEQLLLEYVNRSRADALVEAQRLGASTDPDVVQSMDYFGVTAQGLIDSFTDNINTGFIDRYAQPLAFHEDLNEATELHSLDMLQNRFQGHTSSPDPPAPFESGFGPTERAESVGYSGGVAENVYAYADSIPHGHAGFDVDWGVPSLGHRKTIHNDDYKLAGMGVVEGENGSVGPMLITQNFANPGAVSYITGVVFEDLDGDNFYDVGEGRGGVRADVDGSLYYAMTSDSGGYAIPVTEDGVHQLTFSGGGYMTWTTQVIVSDLRNVKVDYVAMAPLLGDANGDGQVDGNDLISVEESFGATGPGILGDANADGQVDGNDLIAVEENFGATRLASSIPEPATALLLGLAGLAALVPGNNKAGNRTPSPIAHHR